MASRKENNGSAASGPITGGWLREGVFLTFLTLMGKATGFVREMLLAYFFGTGIVADAYRVALELTRNSYAVLFGNHVEVSLVALLSRWRVRGLRHDSLLLIRSLAWIGILSGIVVAFFMGYFSEIMAILQVPNYRPEEAKVVSSLIRWISPAIPLTIATFLAGYILMSVHRFRLFSVMSFILNSGTIIIAVAVGNEWLPVTWLSIGYCVSLLIALIAMWLDARKWIRGKARPTMRRIGKVLTPFFRDYWPLLVMSILTQLRVFLEKPIVSDLELGAGSIAALYFARFLVETPAMTLGMILLRMVLPRFSEMIELKRMQDVGREISSMLDVTLWILLPMVALLAAHSFTVVDIVFGYGKFDAEAIQKTGGALIGWSPALWTGLVMPLVFRVFNAQGRNRLLLFVSVTASLLNIGLAFGLSKVFGLAGVGLAQAFAQFGSILFLLPFLPGKLTWKCWKSLLTWWGSALILFIGLKALPLGFGPYLNGIILVAVTVGAWFLISLILPAGRNHLKRLKKIAER